MKILTLLLLLFSACKSPDPSTTTPTPSPSATPSPTATVSPTATPKVEPTATPNGSLTWSAPVVIRKPGTYSGNYKSTDGTPAIEVYTDGGAEVILENCNVTGPGNLIQVWSETKLTIRNCNGYGSGSSPGKFLESANLLSITAENNYMEHVSKGIYLYKFKGPGAHIRKNIARNIFGDNRPSFFQFNQAHGIADVDIAFNQVINEIGKSSVEDNYNFYAATGTASDPIKMHDNFTMGAYPRDINSAFTGTGMTTDGDGTDPSMPGNLRAYDNQFLSTCNASMNLAGGYNIRYYNNRMISSNQKPDGSGAIPTGCLWAATGAWNNFNKPDNSEFWRDNSIDHNIIAFVRPGINIPFANRQDIWSGCYGSVCHDNTSLPNPITLDMEKNEWILWNNKLKSQGISVGSSDHYNNGAKSIGMGSHPNFGEANASATPIPTATPGPTATPSPTPVVTPTPAASDWKYLGHEYETFTVPANSRLRYGLESTFWIEKTYGGEFLCSNAFFNGDPAPAKTKECHIFVGQAAKKKKLNKK